MTYVRFYFLPCFLAIHIDHREIQVQKEKRYRTVPVFIPDDGQCLWLKRVAENKNKHIEFVCCVYVDSSDWLTQQVDVAQT